MTWIWDFAGQVWSPRAALPGSGQAGGLGAGSRGNPQAPELSRSVSVAGCCPGLLAGHPKETGKLRSGNVEVESWDNCRGLLELLEPSRGCVQPLHDAALLGKTPSPPAHLAFTAHPHPEFGFGSSQACSLVRETSSSILRSCQ